MPTTYDDIPEVYSLYQEQKLVQTAIFNLENDGSISSMTVTPSKTPPPPGPGIPLPMTAIINLKLPNSSELIATALESLRARDAEITQELVNLGIVFPEIEPII